MTADSGAGAWAVKDCRCLLLQGRGAGAELHIVLHCPAALADPEKGEASRLYDGAVATIRQGVLSSAEAAEVREAAGHYRKALAVRDRCRQALADAEGNAAGVFSGNGKAANDLAALARDRAQAQGSLQLLEQSTLPTLRRQLEGHLQAFRAAAVDRSRKERTALLARVQDRGRALAGLLAEQGERLAEVIRLAGLEGALGNPFLDQHLANQLAGELAPAEPDTAPAAPDWAPGPDPSLPPQDVGYLGGMRAALASPGSGPAAGHPPLPPNTPVDGWRPAPAGAKGGE